MTMTARCPAAGCGRTTNFPEEFLGHQVRCSHCDKSFKLYPIGEPFHLPYTQSGSAGLPDQPHASTFLGRALHAVMAKWRRALAPAPPRSSEAAPSPAQSGAALCTRVPEARTTGGDANAPAAPPVETVAPRRIGRFEVRAFLGEGAFGTVFQAYDPQLEREVALKVPKPGTLVSPQRIERFLGDAKSAARLRHPHIVPVYDVGREGDYYYIASAFIRGRKLAEDIDEGGIDFRRAARIVRDLAEALAYAHALGIVHRDVKPANVMVDEQGEPHLIDFGLAHRQGSVDQSSSDGDSGACAEGGHTRDGAVMGTPAYMAPEMAKGQHGDPLPASDQYSLGVVLYESLCGRSPFAGPPHLVLFNQIHSEPPPLSATRPGVPLDLETICAKAMAKRPEERFPNCQELADELRRWLEGEPIRTRRMGPIERTVRWCRREPRLAASLGVAAIALMAVVALAVTFGLYTSQANKRLFEKQQETEREREKAELEREKAEREAKHANVEREKAEEEERKANELRVKAERDRALLELARGQSYCESGESRGLGILHVARSLQIATAVGATDLEPVIRRNLTAWSDRTHSLRAATTQTDDVPCLAYSPDGQRILFGRQDGKCGLWHPAEGKVDGWFDHPGPVRAVAFVDDKKIVTAGGRCVQLCSLDGNQPMRLPEDFKDEVTSLAVHQDRERLLILAGCRDGSIWLWDANAQQWRTPFGDHTDEVRSEVRSVAISPTGQEALSGNQEGTVIMWRLSTGEIIHKFNRWQSEHTRGVNCVAFSPDNKYFLTGGVGLFFQGEAHLWKKSGGDAPVARFPHQAEVYAVAFSRDGKTILTGGQDRAARLWDALTQKQVGRTLWHPKDVRALAISPNGRTVVTASDDQTIRLWELAEESPPMRAGLISAAALMPDGRGVLVAGFNSKFRQAELLTEEQLRRKDKGTPVGRALADPDRIAAVAVSGNGKVITIASDLGLISTYRARTPFGPPLNLNAKLTDIALDESGTVLAVGSAVGRLWVVESGNLRLLPGRHSDHIYAVTLSRDGRYLVSGSRDGTACLWRVADGRLLHEFRHRKPVKPVLAVAISSDGTRIVTGYVGGAQIWDAETGEKRGPPFQMLAGITSVAISRKGDLVLIGATDRTARLFDVSTGKQIGPSMLHDAVVKPVAFAEDDNSVWTVSPMGDFRKWPVPLPKEGSAEAIELWAEARTGIQIDDKGVFEALTGDEWLACRDRLERQEKLPLQERDAEDAWKKILTLPAEPAPPPASDRTDPGVQTRPDNPESPKKSEHPSVEDARKLTGKWKLVEAVLQGKSEDLGPLEVEFTEKSIKILFQGSEVAKTTYKLNATHKPKSIDISSFPGIDIVPGPGIYVLDGDKLQICWSQPEGKRPQGFPTKIDKNLSLLVLKRAK
jgi:uncharacterized protein (TIGR03067 family)